MGKNKIIIFVLIVFAVSIGLTTYYFRINKKTSFISLPSLPEPTLVPTNVPSPTPTVEPRVQMKLEIEKEISSIKNDLEKIKTFDNDLYPPEFLFDIPK
jgi:hypothetical protein